MKTISEMQLLVKDAYAKLDELSRSLSEYNHSADAQVTIDFEKLKAIGKRNPIAGHALGKADPLTKKYYITLLMALVYLGTENQEKGWLLLQRIACGAGVEHELSDLSADALILNEKQLDNFTESIISGNLRTVFALDCMLVYISCEHKNQTMLHFLSELFELVKCSSLEVQELSELAKIIANQDSDAYSTYIYRELHFDIIGSLSYVKLFHEGILCHSQEVCIIAYPEKKKISQEIVTKFASAVSPAALILENIIFSNIRDLNIVKKSKSLEIINCELDQKLFTWA